MIVELRMPSPWIFHLACGCDLGPALGGGPIAYDELLAEMGRGRSIVPVVKVRCADHGLQEVIGGEREIIEATAVEGWGA